MVRDSSTSADSAHQPTRRHGLRITVRRAACRATHPAASAASRSPRRTRSTQRGPLRDSRHATRRHRRLHRQDRRPPDPLFSDDANTLIHNAARGYPRAVNNLAVHALTAAFAAKSSIATRNPPSSPSPNVATTESPIIRTPPHRRRRHHTDEDPVPLRGRGLRYIRTIGTNNDGIVCIVSDGQHTKARHDPH